MGSQVWGQAEQDEKKKEDEKEKPIKGHTPGNVGNLTLGED